MVKLKHSDIRKIDEYFVSEPGYILDFSNTTFAEFFEDELNIDVYNQVYATEGTSEAKRLRTFLKLAQPRVAGKLLRALWSIKTAEDRADLHGKLRLASLDYIDAEAFEIASMSLEMINEEFESFVSEIECRGESGAVEGIEILARIFDFDTVLDEIERVKSYIDDDPEDAITAACSLLESVFKSILAELELPFPNKLNISPLYTAIRDPLGLSPKKEGIDPRISEDVSKILSGLVSSVNGIGALRTHGGDAHGRERGIKRVDARIARLSVNSASAIAVFIIESWNAKYPTRTLANIDAALK